MGSFNVAGSVSDLSLGAGTKCVFIPLLPHKFSEDSRNVTVGGNTGIVSNEGPESLFSPFALPIIGTYDDYGSLEDIQVDDNTACIERFFGCSIDDFMNRSAGSAMCEEKKNILESLSGMFEHYDVYQTLIEFDLSRDSILRGADLNDRNLKLFGFVLDRVDDSLKRYNRVYRFPGVTNYIIHSDGTWSHVVEVSIKQKQHHVYSLADLAKIWEELTGININVSQYAHISKFDQMYDQLREAINKFNEDLVSQDEHVREMASTFGNPFGRFFHSDIRFSTYFMGWRYFEELYKNSIIEGKLKKEIADMLHLRSAMFSCNRFFFPAMNGEQFGNPKASKVLLEKSLEIVNEEIKEMEENE